MPATAWSLGAAVVLAVCLAYPHASERMAAQASAPAVVRTPPVSFTVPPGFVVERVAGPPLVDRPIVADFDDEGRLYVAESSGSNDKVERQLAERPHRILRLEDTDGDGRFDRRVVFADRMMLPQGTMWLDGSLYVGAPPSIWKLTDTDGDGVADQREEWFAGKTLTGCANDLHGPYSAPDGMIYWTKGGFAEQTYERPGRDPLVTRAAHIFRRRLGTSLVEPVIAGGMDNPVDVGFTAAGEAIFTATFLEHPQGGRRDALIHAVYGGLYGKPHAVIDSHVRTGDLMAPVCHFGPAAPSGLTSYTSDAFGPGYRGSFFAALFNMQKVTRHVLQPAGATFTSDDSDFLVAGSLDFHPTDVIEDADGTLLVIDTGGWYKLCCPTSQLAKPDVLGAIYRVRRKAAPNIEDPRGRLIPWASLTADQLVPMLSDSRPYVQRRAVAALAGCGGDALALLTGALTSANATTRLNAVWALTRMDAPQARAGVRAAIGDRAPAVRRAAIHSAGLWRDRDATDVLLAAMKATDPAVRRRAAEALGRIGDARAVPALRAAAATPLDRAGTHAVTYALVEIAAPAPTRAGLTGGSRRVQRAALLALDQMPGGGLTFDTIGPLLDAADRETSQTAWWIARRHPEWGPGLAMYFRAGLAGRLPDGRREMIRERLLEVAALPEIQAMLGDLVAGGDTAQEVALDVMAASRLKQLPDAWTAPLSAAMTGEDVGLAKKAVVVARAAGASAGALDQALLRVAADRKAGGDVRLDAIAALGNRLPALDEEQFALIVGSLQPAQPVALRMSAAAIAEKARFSEAQLLALAGVLAASGPLEVPRLLPAFDQGSSEKVGLALVDALSRSTGRSNVRADLLRPRLAKYPHAVQARGEALLASILAEAAGDAGRLDRLVAGMLGGDPRRGQAVFNSPRAACAACHAIGYRGGTLGPDLTSIGQIRSERDLLEAIVFPSASFVRGYEPVIVTTTTGAVHNGVLKAELADEIVLTVGESQEARIPRGQIADMQPGTVSLMPSGYGEQLSRDELADLIAFLKGTKWGAN